MKSKLPLLFCVFLLSACEPSTDKITQHLTENQEEYKLLRLTEQIHNQYIAPFPKYIDTLLTYQKNKVYPNGSVPDENFLIYMYNAFSLIDGAYNPESCKRNKHYFTQDELAFYESQLERGINPFVIDARAILYRYQNVVKPFLHKEILIFALTSDNEKHKNTLDGKKINLDSTFIYQGDIISDNQKRIQKAIQADLSTMFNSKALYCGSFTFEYLDAIQQAFQKIYDRYSLTDTDKYKIGLK